MTTVIVSPSSIDITSTQEATATVTDASGNLLPGHMIGWVSNNINIAAVNPATGITNSLGEVYTIVTGTSIGSTSIYATDVTDYAVSNNVSVTVTACSYVNVGDVIRLAARPTNGTPPYLVVFYKNLTELGRYSNVPENTQKTYDYILLSSDVGSRKFSVVINDSCDIYQSSTEFCYVLVSSVCNVVSCSLTIL